MVRNFGLRSRSLPAWDPSQPSQRESFHKPSHNRAIYLIVLGAGYVLPWLYLFAIWTGLTR